MKQKKTTLKKILVAGKITIPSILLFSIYLWFTIQYGFKIILQPIVFQGILQVIATLLGFSIVGIFYYMGKSDEHQREFMRIFYSTSKDIRENNNIIKKDESIEVLNSIRELILLAHNGLRSATMIWGTITIVSYSIGLGFALGGLILPAFTKDFPNMMILIIDVIIIFTSLYYYFEFWKETQQTQDKILGLMRKMYDFKGVK